MKVEHWLECSVRCGKCNRTVLGRIGFSKQVQIVDSEGFMVFDPEPICDSCLETEP